MAPQRGGVHPPINLEVFFTHILATATRLNTSYGLKTLHAQSSRHVGITQKVLRHIRHFDGFMTSSMSDFFVILQFFATGSVFKCVETLDFHIEYVF